MTRRWLVPLSTLALIAVLAGAAAASHLKTQPRKNRVVYHLSEAGVDKARFVLGNIQNTITGVGGSSHIEAIELVVHGPALDVRDIEHRSAAQGMLAELQGQGVAFGACGNTMKAFNLTLEQLPAGAHHLPQGGVVRIMELVEEGYVYLRP